MLKEEYKVGDVVQAKDANFSWWPAIIKELDLERKKETATISLIGKGLDRKVFCSNLRPFDLKRIKLDGRRKNSAKFLHALSVAAGIREGLSSVEGRICDHATSKGMWTEEQYRDMQELRGKRTIPEATQTQQEPPKKTIKLEEIASLLTESFEASGKVKADEAIPILQTKIESILEHKDANKVTPGDIDAIEKSLEEVITREAPIDLLTEHKIGLLLNSFHEFVCSRAELKVLEAVTRCAVKKLMKRTSEVLFGERKVLQCVSEGKEGTSEAVCSPAKQGAQAASGSSEIEDRTKTNAEMDKGKDEEVSLAEIKTTKRGRRRIVNKPTCSYGLRQIARKSRERAKSNKLPRNPKDEDKRVDSGRKGSFKKRRKMDADPKDTGEITSELIKLLEKVSSTVITR